MTCSNTLRQMLSAELAELEPGHSGEVGQHLLGCARCQRVAAQLRLDSSQLAVAVKLPAIAMAPIRGRATRPWMVGLAATAAVAVVAVLATRGPTDRPPAVTTAITAPRPAVPVESPLSTPVVTPPRSTGAADSGAVRQVSPPGTAPRATLAVAYDAPTPVVAAPFESPTPVSAVVLEATPSLALAANIDQGAGPIPTPNRNGRVLPSSDPDITVLWFH